jgi:hypothetical protein
MFIAPPFSCYKIYVSLTLQYSASMHYLASSNRRFIMVNGDFLWFGSARSEQRRAVSPVSPFFALSRVTYLFHSISSTKAKVSPEEQRSQRCGRMQHRAWTIA